MFSVLMAVYAGDKPEWLDSSLMSLYRQTVPAAQVVMVVDGPISNEIENILKKYLSLLPLEIHVLEKNSGLPEALNFGIQFITQPWVIRFDSDDVCRANRLEICQQFIARNNVDFFGAQIFEFDSGSNRNIGVRRVPRDAAGIRSMLYWRNPFNHVTICIKKEILVSCNFPAIPGFEDYALWVSLISRKLVFCNINDVLVDVRAGSSMMQRRSGLRYVFGEWKFRKFFFRCKGFNKAKIILFGLTRGVIFLLPEKLKTVIYHLFLREKAVSAQINS